MRKNTYYILLLLIGFICNSCNNFLDQVPDQRTENLDTPDKIAQLLVSAYPSASYCTLNELRSDNAIQTISSLTQEKIIDEAFIWGDEFDYKIDTPDFFWEQSYLSIAAANMAIEAIEKLGGGKDYDRLLGEALICRAYNHFMLVSLFSKFYDPKASNLDPGIPYVLTPETTPNAKYERKTVAYVYEMIEKDLERGLPLIEDQYKIPAYHFTKRASRAFATRFYLFKGEYSKVIEHAEIAFPGQSIGAFLRPSIEYKNMTIPDLEIIFTRANQPSNLLLASCASLWARNVGESLYGVSENMMAAILYNNVFGKSYAFKNVTYGSGDYCQFILKFNEYFVKKNTNDAIGEPYVMAPLFVTDEVLLNRAEAKIYTKDYQGAISDLNLWASKNIEGFLQTYYLNEQKAKDYYGIADIESALIQSVLDIRRVAFLHEGLRWFDNLRYKMPIVHKYTDGREIELQTNDPRRLLQLPQTAVRAGLDLNPR